MLFADQEGSELRVRKGRRAVNYSAKNMYLVIDGTTGRKLHCRGSLDDVFCLHLLVGKERLLQPGCTETPPMQPTNTT